MRVYLLSKGDWDNCYHLGMFATADLAKSHAPPLHNLSPWVGHGDDWSASSADGYALDIEAFEVMDAGE